jgi:hypothetical protein
MYVKSENYWCDSRMPAVNNLSFVISLYMTYNLRGDRLRSRAYTLSSLI